MNRFTIAILIGLAWLAARRAGDISPAPSPAPGLAGFAQRMSAADREAIRTAYSVLARTLEADDPADPAFVDCLSLRAAHKGALLAVWRGAMGNQPGKYPGLADALEQEVASAIGDANVPLSPAIRQQAAAAFSRIASSF